MRFTHFASPALALLVGSVAAHSDSCPGPVQPVASPSAPAKAKSTPTSDQVVLDVDLVIIGGGSAGIHAAIQLKDAGAKVVVIEKKNQIGGHAETYQAPNAPPINVGVVLFENSTVVTDYFSRLKVKTTFTNPSTDIAPGNPAVLNYDFSLGFPIPPQNASATQARNQAVAAAVQSYSINVLAKYPWIDTGFLVPDPVPEELLMPFGQLAKKYNFEALLPLISMFNWYTGDVSTITSLYGVKGLGPGLINSLFGNFIVAASGDTRSLYEAASKELGDSILLESTIVKVRRTAKTGPPVVIHVQQPGQPLKVIHAKKLLVAIPQTMDNIDSYDVSGDERDIFSKFSALGYWAGVATIPGLNNTIRNVGVQTPYNQPVIPGPDGISATTAPGYFTTLLGYNDLNYDEASSQALVRSNLATLAAVGGVPAGSAEAAKFHFTTDHRPYSLRVSTKDIKNGFYRKLLRLQGKRNTYWAGAAFTGHNSGLVWTFNAKTIVPALKKDLGL